MVMGMSVLDDLRSNMEKKKRRGTKQ